MKTSTMLLLGAGALGLGAMALAGGSTPSSCDVITQRIIALAKAVPGWKEPPGARAKLRELCATIPADVLAVAAACLTKVRTLQEAIEVCDPEVTAALTGAGIVGQAPPPPPGPPPGRAAPIPATATFKPRDETGPSPTFKATRRPIFKAVVSQAPPKTRGAPSSTPGTTDAKLRASAGIPGEYNPEAFNGTAHEPGWRFIRGTLRDKIGKTMFADESIVDLPMTPTEQTGSVRPFQNDWNRLVRYLDARETAGYGVDPRLVDVRGLLTVNRGLLGTPTLSADDKNTLRAIEIAADVSDGGPDWPALIKAIP
jgi:hypothetical protein